MNRNIGFDITRALALVLIVLQHAWSMLDLDTDSWGLVCHTYRTLINSGVPLFVMISGALLLNGKPSSATEFLKKRFTRVLIPFVLWGLVVYIVSFITNRYADFESVFQFVLNFIPFLLENKVAEYHWFVHMLIALYFITPILQRAFSLSSRRFVEYCLLVWIGLILLKQFYTEFYLLNYVSSLFIFVGYYISGFYISKYLTNYRTNLIWGALGMVGLYVANVCGASFGMSIRALESVQTLCCFLCFSSIKYIPLWLNKIAITPLSRYSYLIYLIHIPLIRVLYNIGFDQLVPLPIMPLIAAFVVLITCGFFAYCLDTIPFVKNKWVGI